MLQVVSRVGVSHDEFVEKEEQFVKTYAENIATEFAVRIESFLLFAFGLNNFD